MRIDAVQRPSACLEALQGAPALTEHAVCNRAPALRGRVAAPALWHGPRHSARTDSRSRRVVSYAG